MKFFEVEKLSREVWQSLDLGDAEVHMELLEKVTHKYVLLADGDEKPPYAVIGLMPGSVLSPYIVLWFSLAKEVKPTRAQLLSGKKLLEEFFSRNNSTVFKAEIFNEDLIGARFAEFCGFKPTDKLECRTVYERKV